MQSLAQTLRPEAPVYEGFNSVYTTLYELIETISKEIDPGEDRLVPKIIFDLFDRGVVKFSNSSTKALKDTRVFL